MWNLKTIDPGEYSVIWYDLLSEGPILNGSLVVTIPSGYSWKTLTKEARVALHVAEYACGFIVLQRTEN